MNKKRNLTLSKPGITKKWAVEESLPPVPKRRSKVIQEAFDFFVALPIGKSALIPWAERSPARTAAADFGATFPLLTIRFRSENKERLRCWKEAVEPKVTT